MTVTFTDLVADRAASSKSISFLINVGTSKLPAELILEQAEHWIWERLRLRENRLLTVGTIPLAADTLDLPSTYQTMILCELTGEHARQLTPSPPHRVHAITGWDEDNVKAEGVPQEFYEREGVLQFDCRAEEILNYQLLHYGILPALSADNLGNVLTGRCLPILMAATMIFANEFMKDDEEKVYWTTIAEKRIGEQNARTDRTYGKIADTVVV
jgi:hypothetical protein